MSSLPTTPTSCHAFVGGEYEIGDTFESRLRKEFEEETNAGKRGPLSLHSSVLADNPLILNKYF
ncbi:8-oxo-dGTP pyrophosphatase MutT (NUDIX family) [Rhizobium sp. BK529]|uniref:hypothetical protein n=1 Tax=unclassified Rhizobium TaxID=2613769 RepID=UPI00105110A6|nr:MULTISPECIES: hypothetical protein [unclassified Rhizobium]MBB3590722.1 8-oxo-dGTP pyrophosphatase MutT (NUDIX family) [Rhizobium sp. BK529]TCS05412.1 hypothetical protein EV281_1031095 [Rhizobium sp. BK418]